MGIYSLYIFHITIARKRQADREHLPPPLPVSDDDALVSHCTQQSCHAVKRLGHIHNREGRAGSL